MTAKKGVKRAVSSRDLSFFFFKKTLFGVTHKRKHTVANAVPKLS